MSNLVFPHVHLHFRHCRWTSLRPWSWPAGSLPERRAVWHHSPSGREALFLPQVVLFYKPHNLFSRYPIIQSFHLDCWLFPAVSSLSLRGCKVVVAVGIHGNKPGNETLYCVRAAYNTLQGSTVSGSLQCHNQTAPKCFLFLKCKCFCDLLVRKNA